MLEDAEEVYARRRLAGKATALVCPARDFVKREFE